MAKAVPFPAVRQGIYGPCCSLLASTAHISRFCQTYMHFLFPLFLSKNVYLCNFISPSVTIWVICVCHTYVDFDMRRVWGIKRCYSLLSKAQHRLNFVSAICMNTKIRNLYRFCVHTLHLQLFFRWCAHYFACLYYFFFFCALKLYFNLHPHEANGNTLDEPMTCLAKLQILLPRQKAEARGRPHQLLEKFRPVNWRKIHKPIRSDPLCLHYRHRLSHTYCRLMMLLAPRRDYLTRCCSPQTPLLGTHLDRWTLAQHHRLPPIQVSLTCRTCTALNCRHRTGTQQT